MIENNSTNTALISFGIYLLGVFALAWLSSRVRKKKNLLANTFLEAEVWGFGHLHLPSQQPVHPEAVSWDSRH